MLKKVLFILLVFTSGQLFAQDIHFTQFQMAPMNFNPAQTGAFLGTVRVGGIYRDQWSLYKTPSFFIDAPIFSVRKTDWVAVGLSAIKDEAGDGKLNLTGAKLAASYHLSFDKKRKTVLSLGAQYGMMARTVNREKLRFEDQIQNGGQSADYAKLADIKFNEIDAGISLKSVLSKTADFTIGVGLNHFNKPKRSLVNTALKAKARLIAHGELNMGLTDKWGIAPALLYQSYEGASEMELQGVGVYKFSRDWKFRGGLGYRFGDATQIILGANYKDFNVGFAYDIGAFGKDSTVKEIGAFEIAANYIFKKYKQPKVPTAIFCPRF